MINYSLRLSIIVFVLLLTGCAGRFEDSEFNDVPKTKIIHHTSLASQFLSCVSGSLRMTADQREQEKKETRKIFERSPSLKNRLCLACLALADGSSRSLEYSLNLLKEQQKLVPEPDSQLDGLVDLVGRLLACQNEIDRQAKALAEQSLEVDSLRAKMEQLKKIEKLIGQPAKTVLE